MHSLNTQIVIPAKAGIHRSAGKLVPASHDRRFRTDWPLSRSTVDPGLRRDDT